MPLDDPKEYIESKEAKILHGNIEQALEYIESRAFVPGFDEGEELFNAEVTFDCGYSMDLAVRNGIDKDEDEAPFIALSLFNKEGACVVNFEDIDADDVEMFGFAEAPYALAYMEPTKTDAFNDMHFTLTLPH